MTAVATLTQRLFWAWAVQLGVAVFAAWWLHTRGLWRALIQGDPSGISIAITVLSLFVTLWGLVRLVREEPAMELVAWQ